MDKLNKEIKNKEADCNELKKQLANADKATWKGLNDQVKALQQELQDERARNSQQASPKGAGQGSPKGNSEDWKAQYKQLVKKTDEQVSSPAGRCNYTPTSICI